MLRHLLPAVAAAALLGAPAAAQAAPTGPDGTAFYRPPSDLVAGPEGSVVWTRPATGFAAVEGAARTTLVLYRSRDVRGRPAVVSGTVVVPQGAPPAGGWPVVAYGHMTTGSADICAPSTITEGDQEYRRKHEDGRLVRRLLARGIAVVRSDYEGIGTPGPHPYLVGASLARATLNMVRAGRALEPGLAARWAPVGHSEGAAASIWAADAADDVAPELDLRAVAALTPPLTTLDYLRYGKLVPLRLPGLGGAAALGGLVVAGLGAAHPEIEALLHDGGLSPRATALLDDIESRCLTTLSQGASWGGLVPSRITGPRGKELERVGFPLVDASNPERAELPAVPLRLEAGSFDTATPAASILTWARRLRARGADVTFVMHRFGTHSSMLEDPRAMSRLADWVASRLR